ncbi:MAG: BlaI/MecI/CopY family transcriptional regulator [Nannocystaceae bacterium]|nr:BlaI/MecI/CopY family transcriptional regulator [bacterium]
MQDKRPTEAELAILGVLWAKGPSTVRAVHGVLEPERGIGYTTVLKLLQIMLDKGLVCRDTSARSHVYEAAIERTSIQDALVSDLRDKAFDGSAASLVMHALSPQRASADDIARVRAWLDALEGTEP